MNARPTYISYLGRINQLRNMADTLRRANVPEPTINEVVAEEEKRELIVGYVRIVSTTVTGSTVDILGVPQWGTWYGWEFVFQFPPNQPQFLAELIRAQSHPHMRVDVYATEKAGSRLITQVNAYWDYGLPALDPTVMPSFSGAAK